MFYWKKDLSEKAATIKRFEYSPLGKELKAQTDIAKDQYKFFKHQMNVNNKKDGVKAENEIKTEHDIKAENDIKREENKIIDDEGYSYIGKEYNKLIERIFNIELIDSDLHLKNFSSQNHAVINIVDKCLVERKKHLDHIDFNKSIKNLANVDNKKLILKLIKRYRILSKCSKLSRPVSEIEDQYKQIKKDLECRLSSEESQPEETIAETVKLRRQKSGDKEKIVDLSDMPPLEGDEEKIVDLSDMAPLESDEEEVDGRKGLKILTPNKLLTRLPVLLA